jgi:hypothetical protein
MDPTIKKNIKDQSCGWYHTHVSLIRPKGKFQFNRQTLEDFWEAPDIRLGPCEHNQFDVLIKQITCKQKPENPLSRYA